MAGRVAGYLRNNAIGLVALFIALSGTVYAAGLAKNSVKSKQIKNGQVRTADLAPNAVTSDQVAPDALTGSDIDESTLSLTGPAGGDLTGNFPNPRIADGAVTSGSVADGSLTGGDVADTSSLTGSDIDEASLDGAVIQDRVNGTCTAGSAVRAVAPDGTVTCESSIPGTPTGNAGGDLQGTYPDPTVRPDEALHYVGDPGEPVFENSWVNAGGGSAKAAFYKDRFGVVHLRGTVTDGTFANGTTGVIFTLPAGYGPCGASLGSASNSHLRFSTTSNAVLGTIDIFDNGAPTQVRARMGSTFISLDGIDFRADGC